MIQDLRRAGREIVGRVGAEPRSRLSRLASRLRLTAPQATYEIGHDAFVSHSSAGRIGATIMPCTPNGPTLSKERCIIAMSGPMPEGIDELSVDVSCLGALGMGWPQDASTAVDAISGLGRMMETAEIVNATQKGREGALVISEEPELTEAMDNLIRLLVAASPTTDDGCIRITFPTPGSPVSIVGVGTDMSFETGFARRIGSCLPQCIVARTDARHVNHMVEIDPVTIRYPTSSDVMAAFRAMQILDRNFGAGMRDMVLR